MEIIGFLWFNLDGLPIAISSPTLQCRMLHKPCLNINFLAHLNWKFKWAFLVACCQSVRPSACCQSTRPSVSSLFIFSLPLQNHCVNFNQTWHKTSFSEMDSSLFKLSAPPLSKGRSLRNSENTLTKFRNLLQNHWANFKQT